MSAPLLANITDVGAGKTQLSAVRTGVVTIELVNTTGSVAWVQVFNALAANVTLGSTVPLFSIPLAATNGFDTLDFGPNAMDFDTGLTLGATTAVAGGTPAGAGVYAQVVVQ